MTMSYHGIQSTTATTGKFCREWVAAMRPDPLNFSVLDHAHITAFVGQLTKQNGQKATATYFRGAMSSVSFLLKEYKHPIPEDWKVVRCDRFLIYTSVSQVFLISLASRLQEEFTEMSRGLRREVVEWQKTGEIKMKEGKEGLNFHLYQMVGLAMLQLDDRSSPFYHLWLVYPSHAIMFHSLLASYSARFHLLMFVEKHACCAYFQLLMFLTMHVSISCNLWPCMLPSFGISENESLEKTGMHCFHFLILLSVHASNVIAPQVSRCNLSRSGNVEGSTHSAPTQHPLSTHSAPTQHTLSTHSAPTQHIPFFHLLMFVEKHASCAYFQLLMFLTC